MFKSPGGLGKTSGRGGGGGGVPRGRGGNQGLCGLSLMARYLGEMVDREIQSAETKCRRKGNLGDDLEASEKLGLVGKKKC